MLRFPYFCCRLHSVHLNSACEAQEVSGPGHDSFCLLLHVQWFFSCWYLLLADLPLLLFVLGCPYPKMGDPQLQSLCWCPCLSSVSPGPPPTQLAPTTQTCPLYAAQVWGSLWGSPWAQPGVVQTTRSGCLSVSSDGGYLYYNDAALSCSAASLSLCHAPLCSVSMPRLVKAC